MYRIKVYSTPTTCGRITGKYNHDGSQKDVQTGNRYNVQRELIEL